MTRKMLSFISFMVGFLVALTLGRVIDLPTYQFSKSRNIINETLIPDYITNSDKIELVSTAGRTGKVTKSYTLAGFDVYEADNRLIIVKDRYVRGLFNSDNEVYGLFPPSKMALLGEGPFVYYNSRLKSSDGRTGLLVYSNDTNIFEDYGLDGTDFVKTRVQGQNFVPNTIYSMSWLGRSYTTKAVIDDYKCIAIPFADGVLSNNLACCQSHSTGEVELLEHDPVDSWRTIAGRKSSEPPLNYMEARKNCIDNFGTLHNKRWHSFEDFDPKNIILPAVN